MRLLKTDDYQVVEVGKTPPYAILSHRWECEEITFRTFKPEALQDATLSSFSRNLFPSAKKIRGACAVARRQGLDYIWVDTVCIDKSSSEELRTAINSMFKWYHEATVCYTFLNDVLSSFPGPTMFDSFREDRHGRPSDWFERGWTLQELLAPRRMEFYDAHWTPMGSRNELAPFVGRAANIRPEYLNGKMNFRGASNAVKMSWMAGRTTTEVEDIAYSLIGIFSVHLSPQYGEGTRAFSRLQDAIMIDYGTFDESLFAWQWPPNGELRCFRGEHALSPRFSESRWGLLAPSPDCFAYSSNLLVDDRKTKQRPNGGFRKSTYGTTFTADCGDGKSIFGRNKPSLSLPLNCWRVTIEGSLEQVVLQLSGCSRKGWSRSECETLRSLSASRKCGPGPLKRHTLTVMQTYVRID